MSLYYRTSLRKLVIRGAIIPDDFIVDRLEESTEADSQVRTRTSLKVINDIPNWFG